MDETITPGEGLATVMNLGMQLFACGLIIVVVVVMVAQALDMLKGSKKVKAPHNPEGPKSKDDRRCDGARLAEVVAHELKDDRGPLVPEGHYEEPDLSGHGLTPGERSERLKRHRAAHEKAKRDAECDFGLPRLDRSDAKRLEACEHARLAELRKFGEWSDTQDVKILAQHEALVEADEALTAFLTLVEGKSDGAPISELIAGAHAAQALIEGARGGGPTQVAQSRKREVESLREGKQKAYHERNQLVALLASLFPSSLQKTDIEGWDPEWHWCVYIASPAGQMSWHIRETEVELFDHVKRETWPWDGHTTEEKYERIRKLVGAGLDERRTCRRVDGKPGDLPKSKAVFERDNAPSPADEHKQEASEHLREEPEAGERFQAEPTGSDHLFNVYDKGTTWLPGGHAPHMMPRGHGSTASQLVAHTLNRMVHVLGYTIQEAKS